MIDIEGSYTVESPGTTVHIELPFDPEQFRGAVESVRQIDEIENFAQKNEVHLTETSKNYTVAFEGDLEQEEDINNIRSKVRSNVDSKMDEFPDIITNTMRNAAEKVLICFVQVTDAEPESPIQ